jgi:UDP-N-acetylmuramyl pentapeptide phosphotransferase/UDP-N-acetylglucosamine-1-phosphate transferase
MIYLYLVILFYLINLLYIKIWKKFSKLTPNGVGILFIIPLTYFTLKLDLNFFLVISLILFTLIYFLDDVSNLNFYWRLLIQIATSAVIYFSFFTKFKV